MRSLANWRPTRTAVALIILAWLVLITTLSSAVTQTSPAATGLWTKISLLNPALVLTAGTGVLVNHARCSARHSAALEALDAKWGRTALDMSEGRLGSGLRVRRALRNLIAGGTMNIGVLGGSVTYGHGVLEAKEKPWPVVLGELLQTHWPAASVNVTNGARPATGTNYFAYCYHQHVSEQSDLFILEGAINDITGGRTADLPQTLEETEYLVRALETGNPAAGVVVLTTWAPPWHYINGGDTHAAVAEYYDVPRITARAYQYQYLTQQHPDEVFDQYQNPDFSHQNKLGHEYMADILFRYILKEACRAETDDESRTEPTRLTGSAQKSSFDPWKLPRSRISQKWNDDVVPQPGTPWCRSTHRWDARGDYFLQPSRKAGFMPHNVYDKEYWRADKVGSTITVSDVVVPERGNTISIFYHRGNEGDLGMFHCWVDEDKNHAAKFASYWDFGVAVGARGVISAGVAPGPHSVTCEVVENPAAPKMATVKLIAVMGS